jgi:hypothetical protein
VFGKRRPMPCRAFAAKSVEPFANQWSACSDAFRIVNHFDVLYIVLELPALDSADSDARARRPGKPATPMCSWLTVFRVFFTFARHIP